MEAWCFACTCLSMHPLAPAGVPDFVVRCMHTRHGRLCFQSCFQSCRRWAYHAMADCVSSRAG
eukprot:392606-Alexandrium_andersonii.AAC.1